MPEKDPLKELDAMIFKKTEKFVERRKKERRKPGDQRFKDRLVGLKKGAPRKGSDRRTGKDRRKGGSKKG